MPPAVPANPYWAMTTVSASDLVDQYCDVVDRIFGAFLSASIGMGTFSGQLIEWHLHELDDANERPAEERRAMLNPGVTITGVVGGASGDLHSTTLERLIANNAPDGANWLLFANLCVIAIYAYWEDEFRGKLAAAFGRSKNEVVDDSLGELRHIRHSIVHNSGRARSEVERNVALKRFEAGEPIVFTSDELSSLVVEVKTAARRAGNADGISAA